MKHIIILIICMFSFSTLSQEKYVTTNIMVQGDYRYSAPFDLPQTLNDIPKEIQLIAFPDSDGVSFTKKLQKDLDSSCPDCYYSGPNFDKMKSKRMLLYLINNSDSNIIFDAQDGTLMMIQEAKDSTGKWRPIEYWVWSSCGNSYFSNAKLESGKCITTTGYNYTGNYGTEVRFHLYSGGGYGYNGHLYSNAFYSHINYSQFDKMKIKSNIRKFVTFF